MEYLFAADSDSKFAAFNGNISEWDVSKVKYMNAMFWGARSFNQDISSLNVSQVTNMYGMFRYATAFTQNLDSWAIEAAVVVSIMFSESGVTRLSTWCPKRDCF